MGALSGLRVADLTQMLSGGYGSMILADMGAEVIKIERPEQGDLTRSLHSPDSPYSHEGTSSYFLTLGRNKKCITLDLNEDEGKKVFYDLVKVSDIVFDNFRPGVLEKLKIDYDTIKRYNSKIISCSITGFGLTGPSKDRTAYDGVIQAYGGGMSITGERGGQPMRAGIPIADLGGGIFAVIGILSAVQARYQSGIGQKVDISMLDVQVSLWNYMATMYLLTGEIPESIGNDHFVHVPYGVYKTKDIYIFLAIVSDNQWKLLCNILGIPELNSKKYELRAGRQANKDKLENILRDVFLKKIGDEWVDMLSKNNIACAPVNTIDRTLSDDQVISRNMVVDIEYPSGLKIKQPGNPFKLSKTPGETFKPAQALGQQNTEILGSLLNYSPEKIKKLYDLKVI